MDNRPTEEIVLPDSQARVILYSFLTFGEKRKVKRLAYDAIKGTFDKEKKDIELKDFSAAFQIDAEDLALSLLTKQIFNKDGQEVTNKKEFFDTLSDPDGDALYNKVNALTSISDLTPEAKKK